MSSRGAEECEYIYIFFYGINHPAISAHILAHARGGGSGRCGARGKRPVGRACKIASSSRPPRPPRPLGPAARPRANTNASSLTRRLAGFAPKVVTSREARRAATAASALTTHTARRAFSPRAKSALKHRASSSIILSIAEKKKRYYLEILLTSGKFVKLNL